MDNTSKILYDMGIRKIVFRSRPKDEYQLKLLPASKARLAFAKAISLLGPVLSTSVDTYNDYTSSVERAKEDLEAGVVPDKFDLSFFEFSVVLSQQIDRPEFQELMDLLLEGLTKNEQTFDFDEEFRGRLDDQLFIIEVAFKENLSIPFVRWLEEKGFVGIVTSLQSVMSGLSGQQKD